MDSEQWIEVLRAASAWWRIHSNQITVTEITAETTAETNQITVTEITTETTAETTAEITTQTTAETTAVLLPTLPPGR